MSSSQPRDPLDLVRFERPPVTEVALTAQFDSPAVDLGLLGAFAAKVERQFPKQDQRPPAEPVQPETFDRAPGPPPFTIELQPGHVQLPRVWFISRDEERLIQLQADRISVNWRAMGGDPTRYPHYTKLREVFVRQLRTLLTLAAQRGMEIRVTACEVLYVNPIEPPGRAEPGTHPDLATVINRLRRAPKGAFLGQPEDSNWQARWRIPGTDGAPIGRLYVSAAAALSEEQKPIYVIQMNGRTIPEDPGPDAALAALDLGHEWVVKGFEDMTTNKMHEIWERRPS